MNLSGAVETELFAPLSGEIVLLEDVPDVIFAEKIMGDGVAIKPVGHTIVAPCDGIIGKITEMNDAFAIESDSGVEVLVQFGVDTVELRGGGFKRVAQQGERVKRGDTIIELDLAFLEANAKSTLSPVIILNMDDVTALTRLSGTVIAGETPILRVRL
ncbi:MAG: PTS glucose transporter subunit IIA [Nannocystis sp.]|nr:PTS glucose transporter subunit IIA [Nannocystis sp.]